MHGVQHRVRVSAYIGHIRVYDRMHGAQQCVKMHAWGAAEFKNACKGHRRGYGCMPGVQLGCNSLRV
jgi:hypothetical protein